MRTFDSQRLRHQKAVDARLTAEHRDLARKIAGLVLRAATGRTVEGAPIVPPSRKALDDLKTAIWETAVKPYYVGAGNEPLEGPRPRSPYALLLVQGIEGATRIQAERQAAIVKRMVKDPEVVAWLTGPRSMQPVREMAATVSGRITELNAIRLGEDPMVGRTLAGGAFAGDAARLVRPRGSFDAFFRWVDPNGYRLSDRIWRTSVDVRSRINLLLETEIARGTSAVDIAEMLEPFLTPGGAVSRTMKPYPPPYGTEGSYAARRLARTEITVAAHRATVSASIANPFVMGVQWRLSLSHPRIDICDDLARGGPNGDGIYPPDQVPAVPHPHCLCSQLPVTGGSTADLVASLRADIQAARGNLIDAVSAGGNAERGRALQGALNPDFLIRAIMNGTLEDSIMGAVRQAQEGQRDAS